ncbi:MAG: cation:proton antiporter subunit C [Methanomicrobiales archaeon]|nr:cation:proton antiporter subunit C [Methanomicrobiales archaeon]
MLWNLPFIAVVLLTAIGISIILLKKNLVKIFMGLNVLTSAVNLFIIAVGYREGGIAPIFTNAPSPVMVMPTPQALCLTSIVIGVATTAVLLAFAMLLYRMYGTNDVEAIRELRG